MYRVYQVVPLDVEGKDGPQFPTDDWVEEEVMKSSTGWIEVHGGCLVSLQPYLRLSNENLPDGLIVHVLSLF